MQELESGLSTAFVHSGIDSNTLFRPEFISNDYKNGKKVAIAIEKELRQCEEFYISVAFITEGGLAPLKEVLSELQEQGIPGKILTTSYLSFTEPKALKTLASMPNIELRVYDSNEKGALGFHTKGYIFKNNDYYHFIVGSSNMTSKAFAVNKEWNTRLVSTSEGELFKEMMHEFHELWNDAYTYKFEDFIEEYEIKYRAYKEQQKRMALPTLMELPREELKPNKMQVEFIANYKKLLEKGEHRGLLISSCGSGKSLASAFAMKETNQKSVLFLVHREQIAKHALNSYRRLFRNERSYGLISGSSKETDADFVFSTMQTMSKDDILYSFKPDHFQTIVIDEVHRAGANGYRKIMDYFKPDFYLGMSASPERTDGFDIYGLFDHNIAYEIRLQQALENDLLCPFHYYGITDIEIEGNVIDEKVDINHLVREERVNHIIKQAIYYGYDGDRVKGLIFVSRREEGIELSKMFNQRGYRTVFLSGEDSQEKREKAIERLEQDEYEGGLDYIFSVDIMNEGIDAPKVNQVILLRPTESPVVFVQQFGRGLRKAEGKDYVVVIDFIGSYRNNFMIPIALYGDKTLNKDKSKRNVTSGSNMIPGESTIHFDKVSRERIYRSIDAMRGIRTTIKLSFTSLKEKLGRIPYLVDFYECGEVDPIVIINEFKTYTNLYENVEKEKMDVSDYERLVLEYLSSTILSGLRPYELEILSSLMEMDCISCDDIQEKIQNKYYININNEDIKAAVSLLEGNFTKNKEEQDKYSCISILRMDEKNRIYRLNDFKALLSHSEFRKQLEDLIEVGLRIYQDTYRSKDTFKLYEKYSRRDVCLLMNCEKDLSSTMYGMKKIGNDVFVFVTYHKVEAKGQAYVDGKPDYADAFEDNSIFLWDSQIGKGKDSQYVKDVKGATRKHLLVKKSDAEKSFYYMGTFDIDKEEEAKKRDNKGKERKITKFRMKMHNAVREDILQYLQSKIDD